MASESPEAELLDFTEGKYIFGNGTSITTIIACRPYLQKYNRKDATALARQLSSYVDSPYGLLVRCACMH